MRKPACLPAWLATHLSPLVLLLPVPSLQVDRERERFSVALKQSLCGSKDAAYLRSLFRWEPWAAVLGCCMPCHSSEVGLSPYGMLRHCCPSQPCSKLLRGHPRHSV